MKTLYDLLEALPDDDAEGLRAAFRKAAKANHPDFNPGNPEASERFRRIVRANAILSDGQQREAYDRLLEIARQQSPRPEHISGTIRRLAADAIMSAAVCVVLIGGYLVFKPAVGRSIAEATEASRPEPMQASTATEISAPLGRTGQHDQLAAVEAGVTSEAKLPDAEAPAMPHNLAAAANTGIASAVPAAPPARDVATRDVNYYRERGMSAYRAGDLIIALANFDLAIDMDPGLPDSYINRGIVFRRMGDMKRALSDVAEAKRIENSNRNDLASRTRAP